MASATPLKVAENLHVDGRQLFRRPGAGFPSKVRRHAKPQFFRLVVRGDHDELDECADAAAHNSGFFLVSTSVSTGFICRTS